MEIKEHLNHALVEETRPPMYKAMKYWGKKPHNIWREFIECYCPDNGVVLDPFAGSGVAAFEGAIAGRKVIACDINPMFSFFVEVSTCGFDKEKFINVAQSIIDTIKKDKVYQKYYCRRVERKELIIYNYIWKDGTIWKINAKTADNVPYSLTPTNIDAQNCIDQEQLDIPYWYPTEPFPNTPSINGKFIQDMGGNNFSYIWTRRNLYLLSYIFELINKQEKQFHLPLLYAFIHTLHLVSKMVVARQERGNRAYSGSWGRADYMIRNRRMEQNPLIVFERACFDKQGVLSSLRNAEERLPHKLKIHEIKQGARYRAAATINYGQIDVADLLDYVPEKSIDFIITDPPYGGLVQYMDLSLVWLVWLQKYDTKYTPNLAAEITVKKDIVSRNIYKRRLKNAFVNLHKVLKDDGYMVVTFHNKEMQEWNDFVNAVRSAGFKFDKVTHQYNKRSGESNVSNPYGTAGSDFYIRCVKTRDVDFTDDKSALEHFILNKTIEVVSRRAEPTPYDFIINGVLPEMLQAGYLQPEEPSKEINKVLVNYIGADKIFCVDNDTESKAGSIWWFNNPAKYINYPDIPLSDRVDEAVLSILRRQLSVKLDDVIAELFRMYPNGLTPDPRKINDTLAKYAFQSAGKWKLKDSVNVEVSRHSEVIHKLCKIGQRMGFSVFVGKREQPEMISKGQKLRDVCDVINLDQLKDEYGSARIDRISMIDCLYLLDNHIQLIFEVENSTNFSSAIIRASNTAIAIPKYMIVPDERVDELICFSDPLFREAFKENNWRYITYTDISRIATMRTPSLRDIQSASHTI